MTKTKLRAKSFLCLFIHYDLEVVNRNLNFSWLKIFQISKLSNRLKGSTMKYLTMLFIISFLSKIVSWQKKIKNSLIFENLFN